MKMTELPERIMTSLPNKPVNPLRRQQDRGAEQQEEEYEFFLGFCTLLLLLTEKFF
jgi:hypothetical protein